MMPFVRKMNRGLVLFHLIGKDCRVKLQAIGISVACAHLISRKGAETAEKSALLLSALQTSRVVFPHASSATNGSGPVATEQSLGFGCGLATPRALRLCVRRLFSAVIATLRETRIRARCANIDRLLCFCALPGST